MRALLVYPEFPSSFWSFEEALKLLRRKTLLPPLSLVTVAALLPGSWEFRLVDRNVRSISDEDWAWAEIVLLTGMIVQRDDMCDVIREAKSRGKKVAVGGPYATAVPQDVTQAGADYLVLDEGEVTIPKFLASLDQNDSSGTYRSDGEWADMSKSPLPRYDLLNFDDYGEMSVQFSRGCPFMCEFCDIIVLYGRRPRTKTPAQIVAEMQAIYDLGWRRSMFMVDDNFIGNKKLVKPMLRELAKWQEAHGYPFAITTEASLNLADDQELLDLMQAANFGTVFLGVETPDVASLALTKKTQNTRRPLIDAVDTINRSGLRVMAGMIIGFDNEAPGADERILSFVNDTAIPVVNLSMLQALPMTQLSERLANEGRLLEGELSPEKADLSCHTITNFVPTRPLRQIVSEHIRCIQALYEPHAYLERAYRHCMKLSRPKLARRSARPTLSECRAFVTLVWRQGVMRDTRGPFWRYLLSIVRENPAVLKSYIASLAQFEHFYAYRDVAVAEMEKQLDEIDDEILDAAYVAPPRPPVANKRLARKATTVEVDLALDLSA